MAKNIYLGKSRVLVVVYHDEIWPFNTIPNSSKPLTGAIISTLDA
jgi:hypothetical protein